MTAKAAGPNEQVRKTISFGLRKEQQPKATFVDILQAMESLDTTTPRADSPEQTCEEEEGTGFGYDEYIDNGVAKALLGRDYDPTCMYKLCTQQDATTVLKIDPSIPDGVAADGCRKKITEYVLEEDKRDRPILPEETRTELLNVEPRIERKFNFPWRAFLFTMVFVLGMSLWVVFMLYLHSIS